MSKTPVDPKAGGVDEATVYCIPIVAVPADEGVHALKGILIICAGITGVVHVLSE